MRPWLVEDVPMVAELMSGLQQLSWPEDVLHNCFKDSCHHQGWLLLEGGELLGFVLISYQADVCQLLNITVAQNWQSQGLGSYLLRHVVDAARDRGLMGILLEVRVSNQPAIGLYRKQGFIEIGKRKNYYPALNGREDALLMKLSC